MYSPSADGGRQAARDVDDHSPRDELDAVPEHMAAWSDPRNAVIKAMIHLDH
jgi:hypothetical protein